MNLRDAKYGSFKLTAEMLQTGQAVAALDPGKIASYEVKHDRVLLTGEGSSRIFPAKKTIYDSLRYRYRERIFTEAATQSMEYDLADTTVCIASNSGKTNECVRLIRKLKAEGKSRLIGIAALPGTPVLTETDSSYLLTCGKEEAVAATKSVVEQALFYDILFRSRNGQELPDCGKLGALITQVLEMEIPAQITDAVARARMLYFAGRNTGVAEELTLKTNEITRKKSDFLEGTYAVHGIEEVMNADEAVILIEPFEAEQEKFRDVLVNGVGLTVVAVSTHDTIFPTIRIPEYGDFTRYLELAAGWNLLVEAGVKLGINLDKPQRARKVGNEFRG
jgi:glucosamine--fructose-6-phosphate aminotransferase (isomerizing)